MPRIPRVRFLGSQAAGGTQTITPDGVASASTIGTAVLAAFVTLSLSGVPSTSSVGSATLSASATISASGVANSSSIGSAALSSVATISASGVSSSSSVGEATLGSVADTISPTGVASSSTVGTATLGAGDVTISPSGVASTSTVGDAVAAGCTHPCWTEEEILAVTMNYNLENTPFGTITVADAFRIVLSVLAGKVSGAEGSTISFRDMMDSKNRVVATVDPNGNRTAITTLDGSV